MTIIEATQKAEELKASGMDVGDVARAMLKLGMSMNDAVKIVEGLCSPRKKGQRGCSSVSYQWVR